jgi:pimeloyl-ACP methyl ester carboxylesterase
MKSGGNFQIILFCILVFLPTFVEAKTLNFESIYSDGYFVGNNEQSQSDGSNWLTLLENYEVTVISAERANSALSIFSSTREGIWSHVVRSIFPFDTSSIPDNAIIESARLHFTCFSKVNDGPYTRFDWNVYAADPQDDNNLVSSDFNRVGNTAFSQTKTYEETVVGGDNIFELNESGLSYINKEGNSVFSLRNDYYDVQGNEPDWVSYNRAHIKLHYSESQYADKRPRLEISYRVPGETGEKDPVIIIPGIMGSMDAGDGLELDPILHTYDNLWQALVSAGYVEGEDLFSFPYEWRNSNFDSAAILKSRIDQIKENTGKNQVDIVAHSMGGLVARAYMDSVEYENDIDQLIFLGTPHRGATKAYGMWEGADFGKGLENLVLQRIFETEATENYYYGNDAFFRYIHEKPISSIRELLPIYDYLTDESTMFSRSYPNNYPRNLFLEKLNSQSAITKLDDVDVLNIVGDNGVNTWSKSIVSSSTLDDLWEHGMPVNYYGNQSGIIKGPGDGTVPAESNGVFLNDNLKINSGHRQLPSNAKGEVIRELTGESIDLVDDKAYDKLLMVRVMSPVDLMLSDPSGKRLGRNIYGEGKLNEIEGAYYNGFETKVEFATMVNPLAGDYTIELLGVAEGKYRLVVSFIEDGLAVDREFSGYVQKGQILNFSFNLDDNDNLSLIDPFALMQKDLDQAHEEGSISRTRYEHLSRDLGHLVKVYLDQAEIEGEVDKLQKSNQVWHRFELLEKSLNLFADKEWLNVDIYQLLSGDMKNIKKVL